MSYGQNNYSWYASKNAKAAAPGIAPQLYNTALHGSGSSQQVASQPQWNQPQPTYWQPDNTAYSQVQNQGTTSQLGHNAGMQENQWNTAGQSADPWNWGVDDNNQATESEGQNINSGAQSWDWSVQSSNENTTSFASVGAQYNTQPSPVQNTGYFEQQPTEQYVNAPKVHYQNPPISNNNTLPTADKHFTNASQGTGSNYYALNPMQSNQLASNKYPVNNNSSLAGTDTSNLQTSGNYFVPHSTHQLNAPALVNQQNTQAVNNEVSSAGQDYPSTGGSGSANYYTPHSGQLANYGHSPVNVFPNAGEKLEYRNAPTNNSQPNPTVEVNYQDTPTINSTLQNSGSGSFGNQVSQPESSENHPEVYHLEENTAQETNNFIENEVPEELRDNVSVRSASSLNSTQPRFDYMSLQGNDFEYLNPTGTTTGNKGLAAQWSTESLHSQGSDDVSPAIEGVLTPVDHKSSGLYGQSSYDSYASSYPDSPSIGRENTLQGEEHGFPESHSTATLSTVCQQIENLHVSTSDGNSVIVENKETIYQEVNMSRPVSKESSPQPAVQAPPLGPPKAVGTVPGNPYAGSRISSNSKHRVNILAGSGSSEKVTGTMPAEINERNAEPVTGLYRTPDDAVNLETLPDNIEQPDQVQAHRKSASPMAGILRLNPPTIGKDSVPRQRMQEPIYTPSPENQEVTPRCGPDRNQYLETGQLSEDEPQTEFTQFRDGNDWSGLQRMIPGQNLTEPDDARNMIPDQAGVNFNEDNNVSTPPPGLHRMIPGQFTENDTSVSQFTDDRSQDSNDDVLLQRMVPGRLTEEQPASFAMNTMPGDDIPPPGLRRMVPGESSSPESQGMSATQTGSRVVTGDGQEENVQPQSTSAIQSASRTKTEPPVPSPSTLANSSAQPTAERSETIGSDSVETYPPPPVDNKQRDASGRRENNKQDRDRRVREGESTDEREDRRRSNKDYRGREREKSPSGGTERYKGDSRGGRKAEHGGSSRHGDDDRRGKERRTDDRGKAKDRRHGRDVDPSDSDEYESDRNARGERYRRDKSSDSRRYREGRTYEPREGYRDTRDEKVFSRSRRTDQRDTGSEYNSDYDRRDFDRRGKDYGRRDYDARSKPPSGRYRDDYEYGQRYPSNYEVGRYRAADRPELDRSRYEGYDKSFRSDVRPDSRGQARMFYPPDQQAYYASMKPHSMEYYAYYNQLRLTDPVAYADWYTNVYTPQLYKANSYSEDRGSVHSGRSSENNNMYRERNTADENGPPASSTPQRLTPTFFSTAHVRGNLTGRGQLIKILPHYPLDGQQATVEIHEIVDNSVKDQLLAFPGPLIKSLTHKNSVISYCTRKIQVIEQDGDLVDRDSAILLWQLLILIIRQNGVVVGTDISELLLSGSQSVAAKRPRSSVSSSASPYDSQLALNEAPLDLTHQPARFNAKALSEESVTNTFRDYLLHGNSKEALEWAMKNGLWGHALFLASKMDQRTHANVMMRFANGLLMNDPLQTLYQLKSGRQPAAVTCCADEKWGCWRPHLAMILSNSPDSPAVGHRAIMTLGDTLAARGCLFAAHFAYLVVQTGFGHYTERSTAKLVLLGASPNKPFKEFANNDSIQMTEVYEYAMKLHDSDFALPSFQWFKYMYALRLMEQNLLNEALAYAEEVSKAVVHQPDQYTAEFVKNVYELGDRLKHNDPLYTNGLDDGAEQAELPWLLKLQRILDDYNLGVYNNAYASLESTLDRSFSETDAYHQGQHQVEPMQRTHDQDAGTTFNSITANDGPTYQQQEPTNVNDAMVNDPSQYQPLYTNQENSYEQQPYEQQPYEQQPYEQQPLEQQPQWQQTQQWQQPQQTDVSPQSNAYDTSHPSNEGVPQSNYQNQWEDNKSQEELPTPQISLPNSYVDRDEKATSANSKTSPAKAKPRPQASNAKANSGWFNGIWNKLSLKPKNQMILPEDKNPTIVWDPDRKRWVNMDSDGDEVTAELAPPPKASDMPSFSMPNPVSSQYAAGPVQAAPSQPTIGNGDSSLQAPPAPMANGSVNRYKLNSKGKSFRSNYVDVFGGSKMTPQGAPPPGLFPLMAGGTQSIFTPGAVGDASPIVDDQRTSAPVNDGGFDQSRPSDTQAPQEVFAPAVSDNRSNYSGPMMFDPRAYAQPTAAPSNNKYPSH